MTPHLVPTAVELFTICIFNSNFWSTHFQRIYLNAVTKAASVGVIMLKNYLWFQHVCKQTKEHVHLHHIHTFPAIMTSVHWGHKKNLLLIDACFFLQCYIKQQNWSHIWMVMVLHGDIIQIQHLQMLVSDFIAVQIEHVCVFLPPPRRKLPANLPTVLWQACGNFILNVEIEMY